MKKCPHIYDRPITCIICGIGRGTMLKIGKDTYKHKVCLAVPIEPKPKDSPLVIASPKLIRVSPDDSLVKQIQKEMEVKDGV